MIKGTVVYFQCNDWSPSPKEAERFIHQYLEGDFSEHTPMKTDAEVDEWIENDCLCINCDIYDMSIQYWITTTKEWLEQNFPELLSFVSEEPKDYLFKGDKKYFLKYSEENIGVHWWTNEKDYEENMDRFVKV